MVLLIRTFASRRVVDIRVGVVRYVALMMNGLRARKSQSHACVACHCHYHLVDQYVCPPTNRDHEAWRCQERCADYGGGSEAWSCWIRCAGDGDYLVWSCRGCCVSYGRKMCGHVNMNH